jgi:hypothetical protein
MFEGIGSARYFMGNIDGYLWMFAKGGDGARGTQLLSSQYG